jgi:uncharacterized protein YcbX
VIRVGSLHIYPVKSCRGLGVSSAVVEPWGLAGDRRWMVVDEDGRFVSQRNAPRLALVRPHSTDGDALHLTAPGLPPLAVRAPRDGEPIQARVWRDEVAVLLAADEAHAWLSQHLGRDVRLVWLADPAQRQVDPEYARTGETVSLTDGFPVLLASVASLDHLNGWLDEALPMNRFRPNLVVSGSAAWAEDGWQRLRVGSVVFRVVKPCGRCVVTTTDQETLERGPEPLRTLATYRRIDGRLVFGQNLVPETTGTIHVGDPVEPLDPA